MLEKDKLEKVGLEAISLEVCRGRNKVSYIDSDIEESIISQEYNEKYIIDIFIDILGIKKDTGEEINIGKLEGNFFESQFVMDDTSFFDVCDCVGRDLEPLAEVIIDRDGDIKENICDYHENLMYIDRIYVEEKYRNIGIASLVIESLNELLEYTVNLEPHTLILLPKPQEKDKDGHLHNIEYEEEKNICMKKLIKLYRKLGFKKIRNSNYMMKKTRLWE
ncbi:MAG: GNAT family N-acetyltransferase [Clostridia bacterium]|nr:GNAT family N-acetyltransferase [Clostridia bacterium]